MHLAARIHRLEQRNTWEGDTSLALQILFDVSRGQNVRTCKDTKTNESDAKTCTFVAPAASFLSRAIISHQKGGGSSLPRTVSSTWPRTYTTGRVQTEVKVRKNKQKDSTLKWNEKHLCNLCPPRWSKGWSAGTCCSVCLENREERRTHAFFPTQCFYFILFLAVQIHSISSESDCKRPFVCSSQRYIYAAIFPCLCLTVRRANVSAETYIIHTRFKFLQSTPWPRSSK